VQKGKGTPQGTPQTRISGQTIIEELVRNMESGRLEMGYSILLPCIFSVYLHPDDYARLAGVQEIVKEDARRALSARMAEWNGEKALFRRSGKKQYKIAQNDWWIEFFADGESSVPPGDVEIHSELNDAPQPGYRGVKTTLIDREPSVTAARVAQDRERTRHRGAAPAERATPHRIFAEIRYRDDSGPQTYFITQNEISIGRGGEQMWVDLPLYTSEEVSREHVRLRRDPASGTFAIVDKSRNGTWVNRKKLPRDVEQPLPDRAEIGIAEVLELSFEARK
jgi:hypothetical protein